ncbi:MAG: 30S ribosomal protein S10 [Candidatus Diapherotrites archaeon]|nr:30S ribosomal protein S10 [Candidatus Diapherotrites archaeon]
MQKARIRLSSPDYKVLEEVSSNIVDIAKRTGAKYSGPVPLPTKQIEIATRRGMSAGGSKTYERWQMRIHKRLIDIQSDERTLRRIMHIEIPDKVHMEIELMG